jgi:hypothetical protein
VAREQGITDGQIGAVQSVVMAIYACGVSNRAETGKALPEKQRTAFSAFYESTRQNEVLESRTTLMIQIAAALANGCPA